MEIRRRPRRIYQHLAIHGSLVLLVIGETFALRAQIKQIRFEGQPLTPVDIEGRIEMAWVAIAFIVLAIIVGLFGRSLWIAGTLLIHAASMLMWFNAGWATTVIPALLAILIFWVKWIVKSARRRETPTASRNEGVA